MSVYYFAYGSNMNAERMLARDMGVEDSLAGRLAGYRLAFNKRAGSDENMAFANIVYDARSEVEGVLYRLSCTEQIHKMDHFETAPRYYSREIFVVETECGPIPAWVYVANRAMIKHGIKPARWYVEHLLAGRDYLSDAYHQALDTVACLDDELPREELA